MQQSEKKEIRDLIPSEWFSSPQGSSVFVSAFQVLKADYQSFSKMSPFNIFDTHVYPAMGSLSYMDMGTQTVDYGEDGQISINAGIVKPVETKFGAYMLVMTPYSKAGAARSEHEVREGIKAAVGFLVSLFGRNISALKLYDQVIEMDENKFSSYGSVIENPFFFDGPDLTDDLLLQAEAVNARIERLQQGLPTRLKLACRWFEDAIRSQGIDSFLKCWFALETLGMPNTTNIRPLNESLSRIYKIDLKSAEKKFLLGRLQDLRSRVVHNGQVIIIHSSLTLYIEAVFRDIMDDLIGNLPRNRTQEVMNRPDFNLQETISHATG